LLNREAHAGYYSSAWGLLPFSFSKVPIEEIHVEQVSYLVEKLPEIVLERAPEGQVIVPIPIPDGGVDVVVPVPSRIRIPYDNPSSMRVQFSCVLAGGAPLAQCPIRVLQGSAGNISEVMLSEGKSPGGNSVVQFDVAGSHVDSIILDVEPLQPGQTRLSIRNWVVLPPESLQ
jgi:hypothetical protein